MALSEGAEVKNPPANAGDARDTGSVPEWRYPLEEEMATHSSILAWVNAQLGVEKSVLPKVSE